MLTNLIKRETAFTLILLAAISGCVMVPPIVSPPSESRFSELIEPSQLKQGPSSLKNTKGKKLAIVYSRNIKPQLNFNNELKARFNGTSAYSIVAGGDSLKGDAEIVFSNEKLIGAILSPLKEKFETTFIANDIPDAFSQRADYVAIFDIRLDYVINENAPAGMMDVDHTAATSIIVIDKNLLAGPDIATTARLHQLTQGAGAEANNRDFLVNVKQVRTEMIRSFKAEVQKIISN